MQNLGNQTELKNTLRFLLRFLYRYPNPLHQNRSRLHLFRKSVLIYTIILLAIIRDFAKLTDFNRFINYIQKLLEKK